MADTASMKKQKIWRKQKYSFNPLAPNVTQMFVLYSVMLKMPKVSYCWQPTMVTHMQPPFKIQSAADKPGHLILVAKV